MGSQYVVFVDETLVLGSVQMAAASAGLAAKHENGAMLIDGVQELKLRRGVLSALAATLVDGAQAAALGYVGSAASAMGDPAAAAAPDPEDSGDRRIQILEGASAIVIDDEAVDIASLDGVAGLTVFPNIELRLPTPVVVEAAAAVDDWHLQQIGLASGTAGGKDVLIGILDTGIDATHAEFAGKNVHFAEFDAAGRRISNKPRDAGDHGTHVSSTAAGATAGIAPDADLAVAAVLTRRDALGRMSGTLVQIVNGFDWLVKTQFRAGAAPGVDLINASLGGSGFHNYLQNAVRTALTRGIPLIAAIGNAGRSGAGNHGSPGNYPETLGVGASDRTDTIADFSDWGVGAPPAGPNYPLPALCAPGVGVHAAKPGGGFQAMSGTSMATPVVAGVAARRMSANPALIGNPAALLTDLQQRLAPYHPHPVGNLGGAGRIIA